MGYVIALLTVLARLLRATRGTHTTAFGYFRELAFELRRNRSRRVRRYVHVPHVVSKIDAQPAPPIPAPRGPADDESSDALLPIYGREMASDLVRGYYLIQEERKRAEVRQVRGNHLGSIILEGAA